MMGAVNMMDEATASDTYGKAAMKHTLEPKKTHERTSCSPGMALRNTPAPSRGQKARLISSR